MVVYKAECDCGWVGLERGTHHNARIDGKKHKALTGCSVERCPDCRRTVPVLVEGSGLCVRCDVLQFPGAA